MILVYSVFMVEIVLVNQRYVCCDLELMERWTEASLGPRNDIYVCYNDRNDMFEFVVGNVSVSF